MTQGRFDAKEGRTQRENCPFNDLRADGQFQAEYWGAGVGGTVLLPDKLVQRASGSLMKTMTVNCKAAKGCGGLPLPWDTDPGEPALIKLRKLDSRPWTSTKRKTDPFSIPPYVTVPPPPKIIEPREPFFHTGKNVPYLNRPYEFIPDEYGTRVPPAKPDFRLKAGKVPFKLDPRLRFAPGVDQPPPKKKKAPIKREPFIPRQNVCGTFGRYPEHIPVEYEEPSIKVCRRPLFTWHSQSKRSMPVAVPWGTGLTTAEPAKENDPLNVSGSRNPRLAARAASAPARRH